LSPEELVKTFISYYRASRVNGLFLSSGVIHNPDTTMERINRTALLLRRSEFRGYIHLKIIPGASSASIRQAIVLANAVSLNIETAGNHNFQYLSASKNYERDILSAMQLISRLAKEDYAYRKVHQTTQFIVGASCETDKEIIDYSSKLYKELKLNRVYFSAYQRGLGESDLPGEQSSADNNALLNREHRLYQADWLMRKYGFSAEEIPLDINGNLSLETDPKEMWAKLHPEFFPVNLNCADKYNILRVPGIGQIVAERILAFRQNGAKVRALSDLGKLTKTLQKAKRYVVF
jgi:predicted DNA-binding helix-hairpin-helix protein